MALETEEDYFSALESIEAFSNIDPWGEQLKQDSNGNKNNRF